MKTNHLQNIDALRGFAASIVVLHHIYHQFYLDQFSSSINSLLEWFGTMGVNIFFVLSGFCIHIHLALAKVDHPDARLKKKQYVTSRALRILPNYWFTIIISLLCGAFIQSQLLDGTSDMCSILSHLLGVHNFLPNQSYSINGVLWSLALEIQFYFIYLLIADKLKYSWLEAWSFMFVGLLIYFLGSYYLPASNPIRLTIQMLPFVHFWKWFLGALIARYYAETRFSKKVNINFRLALVLISLSCQLLLAYCDFTLGGLHVRYWISPVICMILVFSMIWLEIVLKFEKSFLYKLFVYGGLISYSIYLFHPIGIALTLAMNFEHLSPLNLWVSVVVTILLSVAGYEFIERTFIDKRPRW